MSRSALAQQLAIQMEYASTKLTNLVNHRYINTALAHPKTTANEIKLFPKRASLAAALALRASSDVVA
jgi:hypothetical protein